jgi:Phosphorylase superfamily
MEQKGFSVILVPQGVEYQAVCRGVPRSPQAPIVQAIPAGVRPVGDFLHSLQQTGYFNSQTSVLVLGLCGSLTPTLAVGDRVLYRQCISLSDRTVVSSPQLALGELDHLATRPVVGLTSDRVLWAALEKTQLGQDYGADVVDMEGSAILEALRPSGVTVTMLRVVSDDCHHDLPDLTQAVSPGGNLLPIQLAIAMAKNPIAATRLIRGSLRGLSILQKVVSEIFHSE